MKKKLLVAIAASLVGAPAFAVGAFDGINAQIGVGMGSLNNQTNSSETYSNPPYSGSSSSSGSSSGKPNIFGTVALGYSYGFSNKFNLAANVFYIGGSDDAGTGGYNGSNSNGETYSDSYNVKLKNTFGVSVEPGYYFGDNSLGYLKLGWAQSSLSINSNSYDSTANPTTTSASGSANTQGFLYGLGFKQMLTKEVYLGVEAYQIQYSNKSFSQSTVDGWGGVRSTTNTFKPTMSYGGLILGYKF